MLTRLLAFDAGKRRFRDLNEKEILAVAISSEEEDGHIYAAYATMLRVNFPNSAAMFDGMAAEENEHRRRLVDAYQKRFGDFIIPLRREHIADFYTRRPLGWSRTSAWIAFALRRPRWSKRRMSST